MEEAQVIVIDGGNTQVKLGFFKQKQLLKTHRFNGFNSLNQFISSRDIAVLANVGNPKIQDQLREIGCQIKPIHATGPTPFLNAYKTPETLGIDRLCNVAAVHDMHPKQNVLVVDIGTCIKFDFIDANSSYHGGSISPGIALRFSSLHEHTANLPLLHPKSRWNLIGTSSEESIQNGVMGSVSAELNWRIKEFNNRYEDLVIYLTGGDAHYFDLGQKNNIFVDENLTLKGIYALHLHQFPNSSLL